LKRQSQSKTNSETPTNAMNDKDWDQSTAAFLRSLQIPSTVSVSAGVTLAGKRPRTEESSVRIYF